MISQVQRQRDLARVEQLAEGAVQEEVRLAIPWQVSELVTDLLKCLLVESLRERRDEWAARDIDVNHVGLRQLRLVIRPAIRQLLAHAANRCTVRDERSRILLVDVMSAFAVQWCKIWPFCRPDTQVQT